MSHLLELLNDGADFSSPQNTLGKAVIHLMPQGAF